MNFKKSALILSVFLLATGAFANSNESQLKNCSEIDLREEAKGAICKTAKGGKFKLISTGIFSSAILALDSGLIIDTDLKSDVNHREATNYCVKKGQRLPTVKEFIELDARGFKEAFNGDMNDKLFWSSSEPTNGYFKAYAFEMEGWTGIIEYTTEYDVQFKSLTARCVSGTGVK